ncbi:efflux RND transporter permease subunit [Candidatus Sumerlaeota bacterium]|nr:efflux RND transporter permease subunit [Candidatus Sumerlaeota bacterium]
MIERLIEYCTRNRAVVIAAWVVFALYGIWVMMRTPVDAIPDLSENQVIVFTDWMGRSPKEIEDQVTYPLSVNLQGLAGVKTIRSSSEFNFSMINIIFDDSVDFYFARTRVLERLGLANTYLPQGVTPYLAPDATALGQIFWYTVEGEDTDAGTLRSIQDWYVRYQLNSVPGVAQVSSVGGFPREYQVDVIPERLRAYGVTLGEIYAAIAASNTAVGGRVVQKGNAEYLIRSVGWIQSVDDIKNTVITERDGVPIRVGDVGIVQMGSEFRRSVLEKDGREVVGGVVMMRYGENPLQVTERIHEKIRDLQKGLPDGVRIVPFYERTRLIHSALDTVREILLHELIIATLAILLILTHLRSVLAVVITLPLAILVSFVLMRAFGVSSNIMSLSGIAISIGILVDQAIVMVENATHRLSQQFGDKPITGDTTESVVAACRQVGRPIFFSVVIMVISFLPVFALTGQEGKLFHPLAYTKTFALIGTALISVTLVPALLPLLIRGRLAKEENNWIVRTVVHMYRPLLGMLMKRPRLVIWLFVVLLAVGWHQARHLGKEFMPPLDEGSILDMPVTAPRVSVTQVADDLKVRDAIIREMPEVEMIVGKAGRADTPTDPSPLDMVESIINLRPRAYWVKRRLREEQAHGETQRVVALLEKRKALVFADEHQRASFEDSVTHDALTEFNKAMRREISGTLTSFESDLADDTIRFVVNNILERLDQRHAWKQPLDAGRREAIHKDTVAKHRADCRVAPTAADIERIVDGVVDALHTEHFIDSALADPLAPPDGTINSLKVLLRDSLGLKRSTFADEQEKAVANHRDQKWREWSKEENKRIFPVAMREWEGILVGQIERIARMEGVWKSDSTNGGLDVIAEARDFAHHAFLWHPTKAELVRELDESVKMLGWANIWTQPIINRVDMLATGVRTQLAVKVFGRDLDTVQHVSNEIASALRTIPGAVDVVADQSVGKGYVEILPDRERAARYGISVGQISELVEVALGGRAITTTVEGRERYPVRIRYARDFRMDEESVGNLLVSAGSESMEGKDAAGNATASPAPKPAGAAGKRHVYLRDVADVKVVEGPVMIKSENGLLRAYVQLNVRDRDIVGFVEEARQVVDSKVHLPEGSYLEWTGQFEHQVRARNTLRIVFPAVILLIFLVLYVTYNDFAHAMLMMLAVPGALAGGIIFQRLFGFNFSVAVWVGYIACFGMATETGIIMLVYLRDAIAERGGLAGIASLDVLEEAVMSGAIHRLRPKLLTEGTAILGLAPMLWASGTGAEVIAPMAAPVLGGLLMADEVIDIFLPVLFYHVEARRWRKLHNVPERTGS